MNKFKPYDNKQTFLLPPSVEDFVPEGHLARIIDEVVEQLDTHLIEDKYSELGQKSYHPKILLKILYYGYSTGIRSGRKLSQKCETDTAFMYLSVMYKPNFRTINDFRKDNIELFEKYFVDVLKICSELGMVKVGTIAVDGTKIRANASVKRTKDKAEYEKWLKKVEEDIKEIIEEAVKTDAQEDKIYGNKRGDELPEGLRKREQLRGKIKEVMSGMADEDRKNLTDSDAKNIKSEGIIKPNYNCQTAITEEGIIASGHVTNEASDSNELMKSVHQTEINTGEEVKDVLADGGYGTYDNYEALEKEDKTAYIPDQATAKAEKEKYQDHTKPYDKSKFTYNPQTDTYVCPKGKTLVYSGKSSEGSRRYSVYRGIGCEKCSAKNSCTKAKARIIKREDREGIRERVIQRLSTPEGRAKYKRRKVMSEPPFGHLKFNLKYRMFHLRGLKKVNGEFLLMCTINNIFKIYKRKNELKKAA